MKYIFFIFPDSWVMKYSIARFRFCYFLCHKCKLNLEASSEIEICLCRIMKAKGMIMTSIIALILTPKILYRFPFRSSYVTNRFRSCSMLVDSEVPLHSKFMKSEVRNFSYDFRRKRKHLFKSRIKYTFALFEFLIF